MERTFRIKTNVGVDQSVNINLKQDVDLYEILSLKLKQESLYKLHSANYGVIVGRVLGNDAFGIPNAKVSVFIPLSDADELNSRIKAIYPYKSITDVDDRSVRYNTLPNYKKFACHQPVGSFPNKRLILDDDSVLEIYDKYYKYSTVTNNAGDYMIFGVPTGNQTLHVDIDLSDIGILSQEPRDLIYKGYSIDMFESPTQFKKSTNLDDLAQIYSENTAVSVYPLWGDKTTNEIAITRKDISIQYKFEPTCVFIGSVITDSNTNSISYNCVPGKNLGEADQLSASKGDIEMIRKTVDDTVEEFPIKGSQLIDGDGVWCYQIPMNLDYIGTDEYGNIVPTDNPKKGIPTRTRVRFRITLDESGDDSLSKHKARYLVPNNPDLYDAPIRGGDYEYVIPHVEKNILDSDSYYEFGTLTPDECFRDLYWNKVYSIKSYIPRIQISPYEKTDEYLAIKGVNKTGARSNNPMPFNHLNLNVGIPAFATMMEIFLTDLFGRKDDSLVGTFGILSRAWKTTIRSYSSTYNTDSIREAILEELNGIGLDFYNDWLNGCLYFPTWHWRIRKKVSNKNGEYSFESDFCECKNSRINNEGKDLYIFNNSSLVYEDDDLVIKTKMDGLPSSPDLYTNKKYAQLPYGSQPFFDGIIKKKKNKDGSDVFYYSFGNKLKNSIISREGNSDSYRYVRLFSTDIILLGSLKDNDIDGIPSISISMPSTTSNIPPMGRYKVNDSEENGTNIEGEYGTTEKNVLSYNGMNWGQYWIKYDTPNKSKGYTYRYGTGLFFAPGIDAREATTWVILGWLTTTIYDIVVNSDIKTPINAERICELGVTLDSDFIPDENYPEAVSYMDGLITERELEDNDLRALFATLNNNKLVGEIENKTTGYKTYNLSYLYPTNFDGRLEKIAPEYTSDPSWPTVAKSLDRRNKDYLDFRLGSCTEKEYLTSKEINGIDSYKKASYADGSNYEIANGEVTFIKKIPRRTRYFYGHDADAPSITDANAIPRTGMYYPYAFPLYNNSFYFYYGINQGSTAIDKFYEKFYSKCIEENADAFRISIETKPNDACATSLTGYIIVNVNDASLPCSINVYDKDYVVCYTGVSDNAGSRVEFQITGLTNGAYTIEVTDSIGNTMTETVNLSYNKIYVETQTKDLPIEFAEQSAGNVCNSRKNGELKFISYNINGINVVITDLIKVGEIKDDSNETIGYSFNPSGYNNVLIEVTSINGDEYSVYTCSGSGVSELDHNIIKISKPCTLKVEVFQLCKVGGKYVKSDNSSTSLVTISDTPSIEMYINDVPSKYLLNMNRSAYPYNLHFHGYGNTVTGTGDTSIEGWFGLHQPEIYSKIFTDNLNLPSNNAELATWLKEDGVNTKKDIVIAKLKYMFKLCSAAYVTHGGNNIFSIKAIGANPLIRSGVPVYSDFASNNSETQGSFNSFKTSNASTVQCNEYSPNIVSSNYCYVVNTLPERANVPGCAFNPKYSGATNSAGNYFAVFSDNAGITQITESTCSQDANASYQEIPFNSNPISWLCLNGEENSLMREVYSGRNGNPSRYLRTEFIDMRFDYDFIYITGRRISHYDVNGQETSATWNLARISAVTYNGIEMLYDDNKNIISSNGEDTEYTYNIDRASVTKVTTADPGNFYETKLYYNTSDYIDLTNGFERRKYTGGASSNGTIISGSIVCSDSSIQTGDNAITYAITTDNSTATTCDFGVYLNSGNNKIAYPAIKKLNYYNIPYSDSYTFKNVSCSYDNIVIEENGNNITAKAVPGEEVTHTVDCGEVVNLVCNGFESDCANGRYNIGFTGGSGSNTTLKSSKIKELKLNVNVTDSIGFKSKFGPLGFRICGDNSTHDKLTSAKTATSYSNMESQFSDAKWSVTEDAYVASEAIKNKVYTATSDNITDDTFLNVVFDREYFSTAADSLMKKIRVINTSTIFNVGDFDFSYVSHTTIDDSSVIPGGTINFDVNVDVNVPIPDPEPEPEPDPENPDSNGGNLNANAEGTGTGTGSVSGDVAVNKERDYTVFSFKNSKFLFNSIRDLCFNIFYDNVTANYKLGEGITIISNTGGTIQVGVEWNKHKKLLKDTTNNAIVKTYIKIANNYKTANGDGYLTFAFGFTTSGSGNTFTCFDLE